MKVVTFSWNMPGYFVWTYKSISVCCDLGMKVLFTMSLPTVPNKVDNVGIFVFLKFESILDSVIAHRKFISIYHDKFYMKIVPTVVVFHFIFIRKF